MTKIDYCTNETIDKIRGTIDSFVKEMAAHPHDHDWIADYVGRHPFSPSKYELDLDLIMNDQDPGLSDYDNAVRLYKAFQDAKIPNAIAFNEKFIAGLLLTQEYPFFLWRIGTADSKRVLNSLLFEGGTRRGTARNCLTRLYKIALMTVDNKASDPFYLTRFVFENSNMIRIVYYSSLDSPLVSIPFVLAMKQWKEKSHGAITYDFFEAVRKHLSSYCRVNVAEAMSQEEIVTYLAEYADKINA